MLRAFLDLPRAVHILCVGTLINKLGAFFVPFLTLYLTRELGLSVPLATTAVSLFGLGSVLAVAAGGALADRYGRRIVMLGSLFGSAALLAVYGHLTSAASVLAATFLYSFVADMYRPAVQATIADLVPPLQRPFAFGLIYVAINLGFAIGPALGGALAEKSFGILYYCNAASAAIYGLIILFMIRETLPSRVSASGAPPEAVGAGFATALRYVSKDRAFLGLWFGNLFVWVVFIQSMTTFPLYLEGLGFGTADYGRIIAVNGVMIVLFQAPIAAWVTRLDRGRVLFAAALATAVGFMLMGQARTQWQFSATVAIWTLGEMLQAALVPSIMSDLAPVPLRGRYMGLFTVSFSVGHMIAPPLGGWVLTHLGPDWVWGGSGVVATVGGLLYLAVSPELRKARENARAPATAAQASATNG